MALLREGESPVLPGEEREEKAAGAVGAGWRRLEIVLFLFRCF
jgi:hypothetical protein